MSKAFSYKGRSRASRDVAKVERFDARLSAEQKDLFERAAALRHQTMTQFVVSSAQRAAEETIRENQVITLSIRDSRAVLEALRNPQPAGAWLKQAAERYKAVMGDQ